MGKSLQEQLASVDRDALPEIPPKMLAEWSKRHDGRMPPGVEAPPTTPVVEAAAPPPPPPPPQSQPLPPQGPAPSANWMDAGAEPYGDRPSFPPQPPQNAPAVLPVDQIPPDKLAQWKEQRAAKGYSTEMAPPDKMGPGLGKIAPIGVVGYPMKTEVQPGLPPPATPPSLQQKLAGGPGGPSSYERLLQQQKGEDMATYRRQHELGLQQQQLAHDHAAGETIYRDQAADRADKQSGELKGAEAEYRSAVDDFKKDKIDEDHFWKNRSAGQKAAGFLAAAFGGFLQGFNHLASNPALDQMNHAIDRDIMVQRANHEDKRAAADAQKGMYGMMLDRFHNANVAADMAHAGYLEVVRAKGDEMAAKQNDEGARDAWMAQRQRIDQQIEAYRAKLAGSGMTPERALKLAKDAADIDKVRAETGKIQADAGGPKALAVNLPGGETGQAISTDAQEKYAQISRGADAYEKAIKTIIDIRAKHNGGTIDPADRALAESAAKDALSNYSMMKGFNRTPSDAEMHNLETIIPQHGGEFSPTGATDAQLQAALALAQESRNDAARVYVKPTPGLQQRLAGDGSSPNPLQASLAGGNAAPRPKTFAGVGR